METKKIRISPSPEVIQFNIDKKKTMKIVSNFFKDVAYSVSYIDGCYGIKNNEMILDLHCFNDDITAEQFASSLELDKIEAPLTISLVCFEQTPWNRKSYHFLLKLETKI